MSAGFALQLVLSAASTLLGHHGELLCHVVDQACSFLTAQLVPLAIAG